MDDQKFTLAFLISYKLLSADYTPQLQAIKQTSYELNER